MTAADNTAACKKYRTGKQNRPGRAIQPAAGALKYAGRQHGVKVVNELEALRDRIREFARERDWDQFHSPKNLAMALIVEAGELVEHFQWLQQGESFNLPPDKLRAVQEELADILVYLVRIADRLDIDLLAAAQNKMRSNEAKYPAEKVRGSSRKYTEYR